MILPVVAYGHPVLKKVAEDIPSGFPDLPAFIENMWDTMYQSDGVGLAAPQVGIHVRLFVMNPTGVKIDLDQSVFYNPKLY